MGLTPLPAAPPPEPGPNQVANRNHTTRRYHNTERQLVVDGFTTSLLLVLAAAYLPHVMQGARATRPELQTVLRMAATFLGARSLRQTEYLSGHAEARFTAYLLATKQAEPQAVSLPCDHCVLQRWLRTNDIGTVTKQLGMAAYAARVLQAAALLDAQEVQAFVVLRRIPQPSTDRRVPTHHEDTKAP